MKFTSEQQATFDRDGYIILSGLFEPQQIEAARTEVERITYGQSFADYLAAHECGEKPPADFAPGRSQFPTGVPALDSLIENDAYLDCFAGCLGTNDMAYCNAHLFVRSGPEDNRHSAEPWQGYHIDDNTCSFLPAHPDWKSFAYINSGVMLNDIEPDGAPMHVMPGSHRQLAELLPCCVANGDAIHGTFRDIRELPELAPAAPIVGKAGDVLLYSSYLVHGAVPFQNKRKQRALWTLSLARGANQGWTTYNHLFQYADRGFSVPFWTQTSPRVRRLFGWPPPGHAYYMPQTLELLAAAFPGMDLGAYCEGLGA